MPARHCHAPFPRSGVLVILHSLVLFKQDHSLEGLPYASHKLKNVEAKLQVITDAIPVRLLLLASMAVVHVGHPKDTVLMERPLGHFIAERSVPGLVKPGSQHPERLSCALLDF